MNQFWLWNAFAVIYDHMHMSFWQNQSWSCLFLAKIGGQLGRKCYGWLKMSCTIPIPVVMILACEPTLTLECLCTCRQPCAHVIWAKIAPEFVTFGQIWGSVWQYMVCLDEETMHDSHPKLCRPFSWTRFDFGVLLQQSATMHRCDLGQISPGAVCFFTKTKGQIGRKCGGCLKMRCTIPIPCFINNICELILTLECFCSSLQSFTHLIWASVALKLSVFGQIWGSAWH